MKTRILSMLSTLALALALNGCYMNPPPQDGRSAPAEEQPAGEVGQPGGEIEQPQGEGGEEGEVPPPAPGTEGGEEQQNVPVDPGPSW